MLNMWPVKKVQQKRKTCVDYMEGALLYEKLANVVILIDYEVLDAVKRNKLHRILREIKDFEKLGFRKHVVQYFKCSQNFQRGFLWEGDDETHDCIIIPVTTWDCCLYPFEVVNYIPYKMSILRREIDGV